MKIAIIDSGIPKNTNNKKIKSISLKLSENFDVLEDTEDIYDENGHGSKVYEIINHYLEAYDKIVNIKILDEQLRGHSLCLIRAIEIATKENCDVINISLGTLNLSYYDKMKEIVERAINQGVIIIAANSNKGDTSYPANFKEVYGVFGSDSVLFCDMENNNIYLKNEQIWQSEFLIGNSFMAPHVSGIILELLRKKSYISVENILKLIKERGMA